MLLAVPEVPSISTVESILEAAMTLSPADRLALFHRLQELDAPGVHPDWPAEFDRRVADYRAGRATTATWAEVQARAAQRLAEQSEPARG